MQFPTLKQCRSKNNSDGDLLNNVTNGLRKIKTWYLLVALSNNSRFSFIKLPRWKFFYKKNQFASNHNSISRKWNKGLCFIINKDIKIILHRLKPRCRCWSLFDKDRFSFNASTSDGHKGFTFMNTSFSSNNYVIIFKSNGSCDIMETNWDRDESIDD